MSTEQHEEETSETPEDAPTSTRFSQKTILIIAGGVGLLLILGFCIISFLLVRQFIFNDESTAEEAATPTPLPVVATSQPHVVALSSSGLYSVTLGAPIVLKLPGQDFELQTDMIGNDGVWAPTVSGAGQGAWVNGTVVNYIIGLPDSDDNETYLTELAPGDEIQLITNGRASFTYTFTERELVSVSDTSVYTQNMPGITIILLESDGSERLVVRGRYEVREVVEGAPSNVVNMGETAQVDNIQVTVNSATYIADRAEIPPGFAFFQVDFAVQNVGLTAIDSGSLQMTLVDELGNRYAVNPAASRTGNFPILNGFLNANQVANASAGYQVPLGLDSESVNWTLTNTETGAQVFVTLPFTGGETAVAGTSISLFRAEVSPDLTSLNLGGQITNLGTQPLVVTESDIQLRSPDGSVYLLLSTNPPLPWTIAPGQTVQFFVSYQRPPSGTAVFQVLNQEFQITEQ